VDYRLAPENTYPAALEDAVTAYRAILKEGTDPRQIVLVGDSAGGNLAAALLLSLRDNKMPLPKAAILISPWGYLGSDLPSHVNNIPKDQVLGAKNVRLGGEVAHPRGSYAMEVEQGQHVVLGQVPGEALPGSRG